MNKEQLAELGIPFRLFSINPVVTAPEPRMSAVGLHMQEAARKMCEAAIKEVGKSLGLPEFEITWEKNL